MQMPLIHMNGTNGKVLLEQYMDAIEAVYAALEKVRAIDVNGRDYYPISADAINVAFREKGARLAKIDAVYAELTAIAENISSQIS
jgi:hypothetical protein